jgi:hypothetical protein
MNVLEQAWRRFRARYVCPHKWRPAVQRGIRPDGKTFCSAARHCDLCDRTETMYLGEFYAQFGRMPW